MTELNFYRFVMFWIVVAAIGFGIKKYGDYRVQQFAASQTYPTLAIGHQVGGIQNGMQAGPVNNQTNYDPGILQPPVFQPNVVQPSVVHSVAAAETRSYEPIPLQPSALPPQTSNAWQPPVKQAAAMLPPPTVDQPQTEAAVQEIMQIQKQLGGSQVASILGDGAVSHDGPGNLADHSTDHEELFRETIKDLHQQRFNSAETNNRFNSAQSESAQSGPAQSELASDLSQGESAPALTDAEITTLLEHLALLEMHSKSIDKQNLIESNPAESCQRLSRRLRILLENPESANPMAERWGWSFSR